MKLVVNMMTYNEVVFLPEVIPALQSFCDRLVICDNGCTDNTQDILNKLLRPEDTLLYRPQGNPIDYSRQRNYMIDATEDGDYVLKWDGDELPSDALRANLRSIIESNPGVAAWHVPIYHLMKSMRTVLPIEVPGYHLRLFKKTPLTRFHGNVHEQINAPGPTSIIDHNTGMAVVHFSYFAEARLRRKSAHYATVPGSGFVNPDDLASRLSLTPLPLPDNITFTADPAWLESLQEA